MDQTEAIELFHIASAQIEGVKVDMGKMVQHDAELQIKIDRLTDRVDNGIAATGQKTLSLVTDLVKSIVEYKSLTDNHKLLLEAHGKIIDRLVTAVFTVAVSGVLGGIVSITYLILRRH